MITDAVYYHYLSALLEGKKSRMCQNNCEPPRKKRRCKRDLYQAISKVDVPNWLSLGT